jgi:1-aminocyclopropane-1-carboxylate deaminase/D-cysteine desulfhydrase-like pyridoxal-dependent ACC family enzyme
MLLSNEKIIDESLATPDSLQLNVLNEKNIKADVLRLDKIHSVVSGNKWFKLKYYLQEAVEKKHHTLITFGGAYSNHIIVVAYTANAAGLKSAGIIRGEKPKILSHTLQDAEKYGMQLMFTSREKYAQKNDANFLNELLGKFPSALIIPEGGGGTNGIKGSSEILSLLNTNSYTHIICAIGTGTMFCGLTNSLLIHQKLIGINALKTTEDLLMQFKKNIDSAKISCCEIMYGYHFGGYAKKNNALVEFMNMFYTQTSIPTDFVYTAKLFYAMIDLVKKDFFPAQSKLLIIHSGGLQGNRSMPEGELIF